MRSNIRKYRKLNITTIYVTHDQEEALAISHRIAVMNEGKIEQVGKPRDIYKYPANQFCWKLYRSFRVLDGEATDEGIKVLGKKHINMKLKDD